MSGDFAVAGVRESAAPDAVSGRLGAVLVVDDDPSVRSYFRRLLGARGYAIDEAADGRSALEAIAARPPDLVLLDVNLPEVNGFDVCRQVRQDAATRLTPIIMVTGLDAKPQRIEGLDAGADDFLTKPVDAQELLARVRSLVRIKQYTDDLDSAGAIIMTLAAMIEGRDGCGDGHCHRMANYATSLGRALHLDDADLRTLHRGGFLHDIGMLAIPDAVLRKDGPLEPEEYELVKSHTTVGDALCANLRSLQSVRPIIRSHHERLDGSGYPDGLVGGQVPFLAQIIGVVDVFEAITAHRPYQSPLTAEEAIGVLRTQAMRGLHRRDIVDAFAVVLQSRSTFA
jgi:putative two-component system response regulator